MSTHDAGRRMRLCVSGLVQGVGFRPFVARLARELALTGFVRNTPHGAIIEVQGPCAQVAEFGRRVRAEAPAQATITRMDEAHLPARGTEPGTFVIEPSATTGAATTLIVPDLATCAACLAEIQDPRSRRHGYAFTSCTSCGPRYSILCSLPYDREHTTMAGFVMCRACRDEYHDPADRRFHAQTNACPACGPTLALWDMHGREHGSGAGALDQALARLRDGAIVAIKGLGGFQLMVDACNPEAVARLRGRKHRPHKPLAVLFASLADIQARCHVEPAEAALLASTAAPIVLVRRAMTCDLAEDIAPANPTIGALLPATPLHFLLASAVSRPLVATSGNVSGEPLCTDEHEALHRLTGIADWLLVHDRPVARPVDDSVARILADRVVVLRCSRGYAPLSIDTTHLARAPHPGILALGAHLKSAISATCGDRAVLGQHIGDLDTVEAVDALDRAVHDMRTLHGMEPRMIACDAHPDYHTTHKAHELARTLGCAITSVQHHHAHVLARMAEHGITGPVLGVAWDGTGYGLDRTIWGSEFLLVSRTAMERVAHLRPFPLPGGDGAAREPRRAALGLLFEASGPDVRTMKHLSALPAFTAAELDLLCTAMAAGVHAPRTSSAGRLFDAVAALLDLGPRCTFEGQAAMALEHAVEPGITDSYPFTLAPTPQGVLVADWAPCLHALLAELRAGEPRGAMAARFHNTLVEIMVAVATAVAGRVNISHVILCGGCFQNRYLTERAVARLCARGFEPCWHGRVPPGDGGLALGQLAYTLSAMAEELDHVPGRARQDHRTH